MSITRAKIDLAGRPDEAGAYRTLAKEKEKDAREKDMTLQGQQVMRPATEMYRGHFRRSRRGYGTNLIVDGD